MWLATRLVCIVRKIPTDTNLAKWSFSGFLCSAVYFLTSTFTGVIFSSRRIPLGVIFAGFRLLGRGLNTDFCFWIMFLNSSSPAFDPPLVTALTISSSRSFLLHHVCRPRSQHRFFGCVIHHFLYSHYYEKLTLQIAL